MEASPEYWTLDAGIRCESDLGVIGMPQRWTDSLGSLE